MLPVDLGALFGAVGDVVGAAAGWTFDKVTDGIFRWLAKAMVLMVEWVWQILDRASRPHVLEPWFASGLVARLAPLSLAVIVAMMLANGVSAGFGGRPELVVDTIRESIAALFSTAIALTVIDALLQLVEEASGYVWKLGRTDLLAAMENWLKVSTAPALGQSFIGPLGASLGIIGVLVCAVVLFMRSTLIYVIAAVFPIVRATAVLPMFRASTRKLVHVTVALILAPFVITLTLVVAAKLMGNATDTAGGDQLAAIGTMLSGFLAFAVAGVSPWVLYRVMPTIEGATAGTGIVSGWGRSAMTGAQSAMMVKSAGATRAMSAATRPIAAAALGSGGGGGSANGGRTGRPAVVGVPSARPSAGSASARAGGSGPAEARPATTPAVNATPPGSAQGHSNGSSAGTAPNDSRGAQPDRDKRTGGP